MKKLCYSAFVAFWASVATLLALASLADNNAGRGEVNTAAPAASSQGTTSAQIKAYTLADVAKHNKLEDCWMVIEGKVYDFTAFVSKHPTSPGVLASWCGTEATVGMKTKGFGADHSATAYGLMAQYLLGELAR